MIEVHWSALRNDSDPRWCCTRTLYAYTTPNAREILYIGKADYCTVRERWSAMDKQIFWRDLERERQVRSHRLHRFGKPPRRFALNFRAAQ